MNQDFTEEQKHYLDGFVASSGLMELSPTFAATFGLTAPPPGIAAGPSVPSGPEAIHFLAQDRQVALGKKLVPEETAKRKKFPLDQWDDVVRHAAEGKFPKGTDVLAFKYQGLFYVAPAQDAYMCRLRHPGGIVESYQFRRVAQLAEAFAGGFADVTTRANLQLRQIKARDAVNVIEGLHEAGIINRGSGADNIRNVTGGPTAGIDPQELYDTRPLSRAMHHHILNHREMYGLPRKFNIAFDGGGVISSVEDTNDIGFTAVRVAEGRLDAAGQVIDPGIYFRVCLGGITGHKDFARDTGVLITAEQCVPVAAALVLVFIENGDRSDRKRARLKYVLDLWGLDKFMAEAEKLLPAPLRRLELSQCQPPAPIAKHGHIGFHPQRQEGRCYVGVVLPVGRMTAKQMHGLADLADRFGSGTIRLTVWQNLLISDIAVSDVEAVKQRLLELELDWNATSIRAGLIACTGAAGCKFAASHTKQHATELAEYLESRVQLDSPVNIHFTGCPNSCAQHYMGDIGLIGAKVPVDDDLVEGYHLYVGGGYGAEQGIGREIFRNVVAGEVPLVVERILRAYLDRREGVAETFRQFVLRHSTEQLGELFAGQALTA